MQREINVTSLRLCVFATLRYKGKDSGKLFLSRQR